ncbi:YfgM family protein [Dokdonella fugitiva]|jgi:predicted negative regulator of RcsB-dependent stress response|uniref:YfgM family protein n=1 Tax=Dokdonella fugitiva TaxID=328517 RepID=UPI0015FD8412|nr:tetratricopeptide repeat protein [Dokdonella fugitiva]MBA8883361.1 putative negative regulator of RcsB-dependent stress response [Dokdonella fugitiva]
MSFDVLDEHEQGELVQKWLRENAAAIAAGIALGLVLIFGWRQWNSHQASQNEAAASRYQALADAVEAKKPDDALQVAETLRTEFPKSTYAVLAALQQAEIAVGKNDLAGAASALDWAREHARDDSLGALIALRSARVKLAQGDADAALKLVDGVPKGSYTATAAEIRGDAYVKLGRADDARKAYEEALANPANGAMMMPGSVLEMKLEDVGGSMPATGGLVVPAMEKPAS